MLRAIYKTGSSLFLPNSNDNDVVYFYDTEEEAKEALKNYNHDSEYDIHFRHLGSRKIFLGCYIHHFVELVEGDDLGFDKFNMFEEETKKEYVALLKKYIGLRKESKWWYHILTACYMYKNGSYDLTEAQLKAIQSTHDKGITNAKYNLCIEVLNEIE